MFWFFLIMSVVIAFVGLLFLAAPQRMLFLMPETEKQHLLKGSYYFVIARIGGALMLFLCAPMTLLFGFLMLAA